jgi:hypothetical protein
MTLDLSLFPKNSNKTHVSYVGNFNPNIVEDLIGFVENDGLQKSPEPTTKPQVETVELEVEQTEKVEL